MDHRTLQLLVALLLLIPLARAIWVSTQLLFVRVKDGDIRVIRGRLPGEILSDLRDVFRKSRETGWLRITIVHGAASVKSGGNLSAATIQQVRNVIGTVPVYKLRSGRVRRRHR
jgi:hypothetical protein